MFFHACEIKIPYTPTHELAILGYSAPTLYLHGVDAAAPVSHNGSKHFQTLSLGLPCVGIGCEDGNTGKAMAQQLSNSPNLLPASRCSSILQKALDNQLHALPLVHTVS